MEPEAVLKPPPPPTSLGHRRRRRCRKKALDELLSCKPADGDALPRRAYTLDQHCMLGRLPDLLANKVASYCALAFGDASDEVEACISAAARACPDGLRVKELLETFEAYREIAAFAHTAGKVRPLDTIYDMACGHGMLGALL
eukprot:CAMPEP_0172742510 /NCGR_PEP_ID=MMETSP1074-20121228/129706_1 /TAXON_ID=2916 /ORGANISM="Ceratium fusus, Strain PA161109" /LENGTH=142 /DNA_ID=CAMNT_0013573069 /DNA_START=35 /DNA_END=460 /DNA_ORIENTATION=+